MYQFLDRYLRRKHGETQNYPFLLGRKNIYILPTKFGWIFCLILGTLLFGSINYNSNLGYFATFLLGSMAGLSIFTTHANLVGLQILSGKCDPLFAGEMVQLILRVCKAGGAFGLRFSLKDSQNKEKLHDVPVDTECTVTVQSPTTKRGIWHAGILTIETVYPFGLFRAWSLLPLSTSTLVFPKPLKGAGINPRDLASSASEGVVQTSGVDDFDTLRNYMAGDPLQHIHWKAWARAGLLVTKQFVSYQGAVMVIDWHALNDEYEVKLCRLCEMVIRAANNDTTYSLILPGRILGPGNGPQFRFQCLKALALFPPQTSFNRDSSSPKMEKKVK